MLEGRSASARKKYFTTPTPLCTHSDACLSLGCHLRAISKFAEVNGASQGLPYMGVTLSFVRIGQSRSLTEADPGRHASLHMARRPGYRRLDDVAEMPRRQAKET